MMETAGATHAMAVVRIRTFLTAVLLVIHTLGAWGWSADAVEPALQAITRLMDALEAGDASGLRDSIWIMEGTRAQELGRDAFVELAVAEKRLEQAAMARFGEAGNRFRCGFDLIFSKADREALAKAKVSFEDRYNASVIRVGEVWPLRVRRAPGKDWQVVLDIVSFELDDDLNSPIPEPDEMSQLRIDRLRALGEAVNAAAARIEAGQIASVVAAEMELVNRLEAVATEFERRLMSLPRRYRWGRNWR